MGELIIEDKPLKEFLKLFSGDEKINLIELGDTWHPAAGFVDETYFKGISTVNDMLKIDYDFRGLVIFIAKIDELIVEYRGDKYKITGDKKELEKLKYNGSCQF